MSKISIETTKDSKFTKFGSVEFVNNSATDQYSDQEQRRGTEVGNQSGGSCQNSGGVS